MNRSLLTIIFVSLAFIYSCGSKQNELKESLIAKEAVMEESVKFMPPEIKNEAVTDDYRPGNSEPENANNNVSVNKKKIIKDGNISVLTKDIASSKKGVDELLKKLNAYYEAENLQNNDQEISYNLKIRVPAENFEKLISGIEQGLVEIKSKSIQARDVTEEFCRHQNTFKEQTGIS